jgi:hypothetical protein
MNDGDEKDKALAAQTPTTTHAPARVGDQAQATQKARRPWKGPKRQQMRVKPQKGVWRGAVRPRGW